uniref:NADH dehydrogenase subunit 6 n=1 Tax=Dirofilaria repens TaxID=31241 RepID=A0A1C9J9Y6_9BILA|nr:NADH dehydrogenase subunit 6 [Dirofilaria repens]
MFYFSVFLAFFMFCLSFLESDPLKNCVMKCLGILFMSCYLSLGVHVWYSYFVILIFLSGIFFLLTYFCSMISFNYFYKYYYFFFFFLFFLFFFFFFDFDVFSFFFLDYNFLCIYYDFNYYYVFWIIFVLFLFLVLFSFSFNGGGYMRGL